MKNLAKSILNYYATYTETGFRFAGSSKYKWLETELGLDTTVFSAFSTEIFTSISKGLNPKIIIKPKDHMVPFDEKLLKQKLEGILTDKFNEVYLKSCLVEAEKEYAKKTQTFVSSTDNVLEKKELTIKDETLIFQQAVEIYVQALKEFYKELITTVSDETKHKLKKHSHIIKFPSSAYSLATTLAKIKRDISLIGEETNNPGLFIEKVKMYFEQDQNLTLYDLYYSLQSFAPFMRAGKSPATYLYFHSIGTEKESYPLFFIEVNISLQEDGVIISFPRNFMNINTQAINHFELGDVLTLPRSFPVSQAKNYISALQHYLQVRFKTSENFIFEPQFQKFVSDIKPNISIESRIGFCTVSEEDRKLLDYSEILSNVDGGKEQSFTTFIDQCLTGNKPNYQEEIDTKFKAEYPIQSPRRFYSESPLPLNDSQKRILLALEKSDNKIIVVDGPPGTGKSHTISAITYWANQKKKTVVLTSYKEQALDVLERMLENKFSSIHPNIKPTLLRFSQNTNSENTLHQKLQPASINSANDRTIQFPKEAVIKDTKNHKEELEKNLLDKLSDAKNYQKRVRAIIEYESSKKILIEKFNLEEDVFAQIPKGDKKNISLEKIKNISIWNSLQNTTLTELQYVINNEGKIPDFLQACEIISQNEKNIPKDLDQTTQLFDISKELRSDIEYIISHIKGSILIKDVHPDKHKNGSFISNIFTRIDSERIKNAIKTLTSLKGNDILKTIAKLLQKDLAGLTIANLQNGFEFYDILTTIQTANKKLSSYITCLVDKNINITSLYDRISKLQKVSHEFSENIVEVLLDLFNKYQPILSKLEIYPTDLSTINRITEGTEFSQYLSSFIESNELLDLIDVGQNQTIENLKSEYSTSIQKSIENENAERFKNLNKHLNDIAKIKQTYDAGQRFTLDHTRILLDAFSCIISEPALISRFFPMEEELIDVLVIDEASQVSIADALSLILRAKQVVIFGDEYQYGAVKATNASTLYTSGYYKEIIDAFKKDLSKNVTTQQEKKLIEDVTIELSDDEDEIFTLPSRDEENAIRWLEVFKIRVSALVFCRALANYSASLKEHFRSYPEIISYSNEFFYKKNQLELIPNRIRTKPIKETLVFMKVDTKGFAGQNINLDEVEAIAKDMQNRFDAGYAGSIGIITSFREQQRKMEEYLRQHFDYHLLTKKHKIAVWFVRDVQGEERDLIYYSLVQDDKFPNAELSTIYPVPDGIADTPRSIKMQQLNVGFSRAKDTMVFVHSMPLEKYSKTRLGDALQHYYKLYEETYAREKDLVVDEKVFESPMEKEMYMLITNTAFFKKNQDHLRMIPQFKIGEYIKAEYQKYIPSYRADLLMALTIAGKEHPLIVEYDGFEYHFKNPSDVDKYSFSQEYLDYDVARQRELESYGYRFLRINKFILQPRKDIGTKVDIMNKLLTDVFSLLINN